MRNETSSSAPHPPSARWLAVASVVVLAFALIGIAGFGSRPSIDKVPAAAPATFDPALVRKGAQLAAIGDCAGCHTAAGGAAYAGGVPVRTPFGTIHATNITPEPETGIGAWSEDAFRRALREGVSRDGHLLYPAFPYDHFTHLTDADIAALYAFVMTRDPVRAPALANHLVFPLQFRPLVAAWNALYLHQGPLPVAQGAPAQMERGRYLVDALAHCAACHTPRNMLGAERRDAPFGGGDAEGWHATALNENAPSPVPWTAETLAAYLRSGLVADHAMTAGPMRDVIAHLARADAADVDAIAAFMAGQIGPPDVRRQAREQAAHAKAAQPLAAASQAQAGSDPTLVLGRSVYASACASCHDLGRGLSSSSAMQLPLAVALYLPDPRNVVHIIREGIAPVGHVGRRMPPFAGALSDDEITALVAWLRTQAPGTQPWSDVAKVVKDTGEAP